MRISLSRFVVPLGAAALALLVAGAAHAQVIGPNAGSRGFQPPVKQKVLPGDVTRPPPPALPGAKAPYEPAERTATDLSPNAALFDAINRGDIGSARDAISHGADLNVHNILGMTPVELSVDLSRNDITFLLLSLRNGSAPTTAIATASNGAPAEKALPGKAVRKVAAARPAHAAVPVPKPAPAPQEFARATDPGTPDPQAGFLGFGGPAR